jgi:hypothetical protein
MINWEYYSKRRSVTLIKFIKDNDIENYDQLSTVLLKKGVTSPTETAFEIAHKLALPKIASKQKPHRKPKEEKVSDVTKTKSETKTKTLTRPRKPKGK